MFWLKAFRIAGYCALASEILAMPCIRARAQQVDDPGPAAISASDDGFQLENRVIGARVSMKDRKLSGLVITDRLHGTSVPVPSPFAILFKDGSIWRAGDLTTSLQPNVIKTVPSPDASRASDKIAGAEIEIALDSADHALHVVWSIVLHDGSTYLRQFLEFRAVGQDAPISRVELIDLALPDAHVSGSVEGSPLVAGNLFLGFEHPLSHSKVTGGRATAWIDRDLPLRAGQTIVYSSVIGVAHEGQMRRDFLAYIERERAHPYRTFLHYNSWYDLGYFSPYDQTKALDRVDTFGRELTEKRGVKLDSFLFDDGWDNHKSLWRFNDGFPKGFLPIREAAAKFGARPGVWMSPWGGYDGPKQERIAFGKAAGYEIIDGGYALSGPKYYTAFRDVCLSMVRDYGVNHFKFDGTGNVDSVFPGSQFDSDFSAAIHLIGELRAAKPDIFINLTTGTWPSPFWLLYADSIWRGGDDDSTAGVGPYRERWITYRDGETYRRVVQNGPLYPLNSLMLHGLIFAQDHKQLDKDPGNDFRNEIRSYFGTGTQLQEMYITPSLLSQSNWDDLAEAANWSRANADVLKDTHWVGGDPAWLEVYGWASWSPRKGILVLRNPNDHAQDIGIKLREVFELPVNAAQVYHAQSPWKDDAGRRAIVLQANEAHVFHLAPFEVLTLDILPGDSAH
ncbi:MAG: enterotoxin [Terracidiphilus sp.]